MYFQGCLFGTKNNSQKGNSCLFVNCQSAEGNLGHAKEGNQEMPSRGETKRTMGLIFASRLQNGFALNCKIFPLRFSIQNLINLICLRCLFVYMHKNLNLLLVLNPESTLCLTLFPYRNSISIYLFESKK